ncbi:MAG: SCP2 sterol-binding domain-containing protein [Gammaproteobacteria bacterium]|nr:SCP2 sterol-binding domain-containing protein [Gammaproteobacteria bacterium]
MDQLLHLAAAQFNRGIRDSATARAQVADLDGKSLAVIIKPPGYRLRIAINDGRAGFLADELAADAELTGGPLDFQRLLFGEAEAVLRAGRVEIRGDTDTAERFQELLQSAGPDFEEILSRMVGDVAAHEIGMATRAFADWARRASQSLSRSLTEYLQEERRETPTRFEIDEFLNAVDELSNDVDRAAARVARLVARRDS